MQTKEEVTMMVVNYYALRCIKAQKKLNFKRKSKKMQNNGL
jgi:hypothetical protein